MYLAVVVGCLVAEDPTPTQCKIFSSPQFHNSVEACEQDVMTVGAAFLFSQGLYLSDFKCTTTDLFGVGDV